jgi:cyclic pyranopterin monophosphate synthase
VRGFSHIEEGGEVRMVDVGDKPMSRRRARARARIEMKPETAARLAELPKGDALTTAQVAGVMAAKRTSELIPLCHPLPLSVVDIDVAIIENGADVTSTVSTTARTGVEMEALVAATVAALTIYDMAKAVDDSMSLTDVRLLEKTKEEV